MNRKTTLLLLTAGFPYGHGEAFLENELPFLEKNFDNVFLLPLDSSNKHIRPVPTNFIVVNNIPHIPIFKLPFHLPLASVINELFSLILKGRLTFYKIKTIFYYARKAAKIASTINNILSKNKLDFNKCILYSYWLDDKAIAAVFVKNKHSQITSISRAHRWEIFENMHPENYFPFREFIAEKLDAVYFISNDGLKHFNASTKVNSYKLKLSRLGVPERKIVNTSSEKLPFHLVSCSSVIPLKRVLLIFSVISEILKKSNNLVHWTHIGDGPEFSKLKKEVSQSGKEEYFTLTGQVTNNFILDFYSKKSVDLFINLSTIEGIPVSIMEAMSFGIPVLATNVGGNKEIVHDGINGILISVDALPTEIAEKIISFLNLSEQETKRIRNNAYQYCKENYSAEKNYSEFIDQIKSLNPDGISSEVA